MKRNANTVRKTKFALKFFAVYRYRKEMCVYMYTPLSIFYKTKARHRGTKAAKKYIQQFGLLKLYEIYLL